MNAVLTRTLAELIAHGIEGASVDSIARAAEVNKTSIYRRWPTKEALIAAALERVAVDIGALHEDQGSLRGDLMFLAKQIATFLESPIGRSLARAALGESAGPAIAALAAREIERPRDAVKSLYTRARQRNEWRDGISPESVLGALAGGLMHRALLEHTKIAPAYLAQLIDLLVAGVRPA